MTETVHGITYSKPEVVLLQETGIGTSEVAARSCYDSFDNSENDCIRAIDTLNQMGGTNTDLINNIEHSDLLDTLAWTHFHHSILEHANLTYLIKGTSRAVLQEHARHRIQAISVRSTRYTMQQILHAFNATSICLLGDSKATFTAFIKELDMFTVCGTAEVIDIHNMYDKLHHQLIAIGNDTFADITMSKMAKEVYKARTSYQTPRELYDQLCACKDKRNVGDPFKWIVTDNWKVDMVVTFNLRSLKNYLTLRDSGAAYFGIRHLAQAMKEVTPSKYLNLIIKD